MFVRRQWWRQRRRKSQRYYQHAPAIAQAVLVESVRIDGKPKQRHIAYLGSFHNEQDAHYRTSWWQDVNVKLDALGNRMMAEDRLSIEAALDKKVPKVGQISAT